MLKFKANFERVKGFAMARVVWRRSHVIGSAIISIQKLSFRKDIFTKVVRKGIDSGPIGPDLPVTDWTRSLLSPRESKASGKTAVLLISKTDDVTAAIVFNTTCI